jgi:hypothetical protein
VVCHGITDVAKSIDTIVCTESTRGVANQQEQRNFSKRCQSLLYHSIQNLNRINSFIKRSYRSISNIAKSGNKPVHQKTNETNK